MAVGFLVLLSLGFGFQDASMTAQEIMARVAANQDREQSVRSEFVYEQKIHRTMRSKEGKLLREEFWTYTVSPQSKGTTKKLVSVKGKYWKHGQYLPFEGLPLPSVGLMEITLDDGDEGSRDGIDSEMFPLTSEQQKRYTFELIGEKTIKDRTAYEIEFRPTNPRDFGWKGEALIDKEEFQPVSVYTRLSRKLPGAVRTVLGTDVPGLGMNIQYTRVDRDIWFPATYGTEFGVRAVFLFNRKFAESTENSNFRRVDVKSTVAYEAPTEK